MAKSRTFDVTGGRKIDVTKLKEKVENEIKIIESNETLAYSEKQELIRDLKDRYFRLFAENVPEDYETLKKESEFFTQQSIYNAALLAQRLKIIRDKELYRQDGYSDFKDFVENFLHVSRRKAYNDIELIETFGIQTYTIDEPTKLLPVIPLLKSESIEDSEKNKIKKYFLKEIKTRTKSEIADIARQYKEQYGISKSTGKKATDFEAVIKKLQKGYFSDDELHQLKYIISEMIDKR